MGRRRLLSTVTRTREAIDKLAAIEVTNHRAAGKDWEEISLLVGRPPEEVRALAFAYLEADMVSPAPARLEARHLARLRLERAVKAIMQDVDDGNLFAIDRLVKITDQLVKLSELPAIRPEGESSGDLETDLLALVERAVAQANVSDLNDVSLTQLIGAIGPLLDRLNKRESDDLKDDRLARIDHLLNTARTRRASFVGKSTPDVEPDGVQEEGNAGV